MKKGKDIIMEDKTKIAESIRTKIKKAYENKSLKDIERALILINRYAPYIISEKEELEELCKYYSSLIKKDIDGYVLISLFKKAKEQNHITLQRIHDETEIPIYRLSRFYRGKTAATYDELIKHGNVIGLSKDVINKTIESYVPLIIEYYDQMIPNGRLSLGNYIRMTRKEKGYTIEQLATVSDAGLQFLYISRVENGRTKLTPQKYSQLCYALKEDANLFLNNWLEYEKANKYKRIELGEFIKNRREELGISLEDMSLKTGKSVKFLSSIETIKRKVSIDTLKKISIVLEVPIDVLVGKIDTEKKKSVSAIKEIKTKNKKKEAQTIKNNIIKYKYIEIDGDKNNKIDTELFSNLFLYLTYGKKESDYKENVANYYKLICENKHMPSLPTTKDKRGLLGVMIKEARLKKGIKSAQIEEKIGIKKGYYITIEGGVDRVNPTYEKLKQLSEKLDIPMKGLVEASSRKFVENNERTENISSQKVIDTISSANIWTTPDNSYTFYEIVAMLKIIFTKDYNRLEELYKAL